MNNCFAIFVFPKVILTNERVTAGFFMCLLWFSQSRQSFVLQRVICLFVFLSVCPIWAIEVGLPLYYWRQPNFVNFGDYLSLMLVERMVGQTVSVYNRSIHKGPKFLAIGSILSFAGEKDLVWGSGINGKVLSLNNYKFKNLDIRAVRGPLTRDYLVNKLHIKCPEVYGDPALLVPYFFHEFKKKENPSRKYSIIPHYSEIHLFPKSKYPHAIYPTEPWDKVIEKITDSQFVISSSLHGLILADAFGIPARRLKITDHEKDFKFVDYYEGTNRADSQSAHSIEEALKLGGERPADFDPQALADAFPWELWNLPKRHLN